MHIERERDERGHHIVYAKGRPAVVATDHPIQRATIYRQGDGWMIDTADDPHAASVLALFGTTILPMPFFAHVSEALVRDVLERANPGIVITRGGDCPEQLRIRW